MRLPNASLGWGEKKITSRVGGVWRGRMARKKRKERKPHAKARGLWRGEAERYAERLSAALAPRLADERRSRRMKWNTDVPFERGRGLPSARAGGTWREEATLQHRGQLLASAAGTTGANFNCSAKISRHYGGALFPSAVFDIARLLAGIRDRVSGQTCA